jgi:hypothetical protein
MTGLLDALALEPPAALLLPPELPHAAATSKTATTAMPNPTMRRPRRLVLELATLPAP